MKTSVGTFALIGAVLLAGAAQAQTPPQPRGGPTVAAGPRTTAPPTSGGESGSENGETRASSNSSGGRIDIESWSWGRIDRVNTVEACTARRGEVVMHQGVRQCRLPATTRRDEPNVTMQDFHIPR